MQARSSKKPKRPRDLNQLAYQIVQEATGQAAAPRGGSMDSLPPKNPAAVELGKLGGRKGGLARKKALSPERRKEIATLAAQARWKGKKKQP